MGIAKIYKFNKMKPNPNYNDERQQNNEETKNNKLWKK